MAFRVHSHASANSSFLLHIDEFSLHLYIHKQQFTKSASHTTELVNQVNQSHRTELVTLSVNTIAEVSIPLKMQEA